MTIPMKQRPKMQKVCDKCYQDSSKTTTQDISINRLVFKQDSAKCCINDCNKRFNWITHKVSRLFNIFAFDKKNNYNIIL